MCQNFPKERYNRRSIVETINSVEKRKFDDELRSKLLKTPVYQLCCISSGMISTESDEHEFSRERVEKFADTLLELSGKKGQRNLF